MPFTIREVLNVSIPSEMSSGTRLLNLINQFDAAVEIGLYDIPKFRTTILM